MNKPKGLPNRRSLQLQATSLIFTLVVLIIVFTETTTTTMKVINGGVIILCLALLGFVSARLLKHRKGDTRDSKQN